ncbi:MAG TPA: PAS domain S-box protein [Gaiellales bacterium]|nr:PAS domain S-box protein [Gaiellales bacterium]
MPDLMEARDESVRGAGDGGRPEERPLPTAGDFRHLVEGLPLIVYIDAPDPVSPSLYVSPQTTGVLGYTPEDWASSPDFFVRILHPDDRERVVAETAHMIASGERLQSEYRLLRRDGSVVWVRDEGVLVRDEAGEPMCMQGYMLDITERRQREAALLESNARQRAMLDASLDGVITTDHDGVIVEFNPAAESIFGYARSDALGRRMADLIVPPSQRSTQGHVFRPSPAPEPGPAFGKRIEAVGMRADGSEFALDLSIAEVDVPGAPVFTVYLRDISDQKRREAALLESEAIVDSSFDAIVSRTADGIVTSWNPAAERIFGYNAAEMVGRSIARLTPPEGVLALDEVNASVRRGEVVERFETVRVRKDGRLVEVESTVSPIIGASGAIIGVSAISRDISERKRSQALVSGQADLLEFIATGAALPRVLDRLARFVEEHGDEVLASILLLDRDGIHLRHGAAPSLPEAYCSAVDGLEIGENRGSCGTAAFRRERVCVSDIEADPLWADYRELARGAGVRACWSTPVLATDGVVLGTIALYYQEPRDPGSRDFELVELATHVAGIAIERGRSEEAARESEERYRDLFENANEPIASVAIDERIIEVNRAFERVLGYTREELIGTSLGDYLTPDALEASARATELKLSGKVAGTTYEQEFTAKDGHAVILEVSSRLIEEDGRPVGVQGICRDITARKQAELELGRLSELNRHQALHDGLTGLPNRASFGQQVEHAIAVADADGTQLAVLLMDLDRFKEINDTLGHRYGDLLLVELSRRLESVVRRSDTVARLGGDEFGILVRQLSDSPADLEQALERILAALDQPFQVDGLPLHVEASIGVARFPAHGHDVDLLLQRADVAMYLAKETGAPHALYAAELDRHDAAGLTLLSELPRAIRNRELVLHYQPKLDVRSGELAGVEALVRWDHPVHGLIAPVDFVPAAEKTGLIQALTRYVLDEALAQIARWEAEGHRLDVAVNLSMRNLHDPALPEQVARLLRKWNLPGKRLTVEITESSIVSDPAKTALVVGQLGELGLGIAVDDFGTGYTSLSYLARLAITQLKIDRSFVENMDCSADDAAIVRSIITLGHDLGLELVAEGVETKLICDQLTRLGCDMVQGFWVSRPLPPAELDAWLSHRGTHTDEAAA